MSPESLIMGLLIGAVSLVVLVLVGIPFAFCMASLGKDMIDGAKPAIVRCLAGTIFFSGCMLATAIGVLIYDVFAHKIP